MIRTLSAAALAIALAMPALAETGTTTNTTESAGPTMQNLFTSDQARQHLMHLGYTDVSPLQKDENGRWAGTATKDGKTVFVAVDIKGQAHQK